MTSPASTASVAPAAASSASSCDSSTSSTMKSPRDSERARLSPVRDSIAVSSSSTCRLRSNMLSGPAALVPSNVSRSSRACLRRTGSEMPRTRRSRMRRFCPSASSIHATSSSVPARESWLSSRPTWDARSRSSNMRSIRNTSSSYSRSSASRLSSMRSSDSTSSYRLEITAVVPAAALETRVSDRSDRPWAASSDFAMVPVRRPVASIRAATRAFCALRFSRRRSAVTRSVSSSVSE